MHCITKHISTNKYILNILLIKTEQKLFNTPDTFRTFETIKRNENQCNPCR